MFLQEPLILLLKMMIWKCKCLWIRPSVKLLKHKSILVGITVSVIDLSEYCSFIVTIMKMYIDG